MEKKDEPIQQIKITVTSANVAAAPDEQKRVILRKFRDMPIGESATSAATTIAATTASDELKQKRVVMKKFRDISSDESATKFDLYGEETGKGSVSNEDNANDDDDDNYISSEEETLYADPREARRLSCALHEEAKFGRLQLKEKESLYEQKRASWQGNLDKIPEISRVLVHDDDLLSQSSENKRSTPQSEQHDPKSNLTSKISRLKVH
jgi:hypothetical protein